MSPFTTLRDVVLLPKQKQALEAYVENGESLYINSEFRDPEERVLEPRDAEKVRKYARNLQQLIESVPGSTERAVVFRGQVMRRPSGGFREGMELQQLRETFLSTSFKESVARDFIDDEVPECCVRTLLTLTIPKGTKGLHVTGTSIAAAWADEDEVILPPGCTFEIDKVELDEEIYFIQATLTGHSRVRLPNRSMARSEVAKAQPQSHEPLEVVDLVSEDDSDDDSGSPTTLRF